MHICFSLLFSRLRKTLIQIASFPGPDSVILFKTFLLNQISLTRLFSNTAMHVHTLPTVTESGIYLDVSNMFHNMPLPLHMIDLFPLPTITFRQLDAEAQTAVPKSIGAPNLHVGIIIRLSQAKMPMGFTWAVFLAHNATTNIMKEAYNTTRSNNLQKINNNQLKVLTEPAPPLC